MVARKGLSSNPMRMLLLANAAMWVICIVSPLQASITLLRPVGMFVWLCLIPIVEAAEQTVLRNESSRPNGRAGSSDLPSPSSNRQPRSPRSSIGRIAQIFFIPFMTTGAGVQALGPWFGTGVDRGIGLLFIVAGWIGLVVTLLAMRSNSYRLLSKRYEIPGQPTEGQIEASFVPG